MKKLGDLPFYLGGGPIDLLPVDYSGGGLIMMHYLFDIGRKIFNILFLLNSVLT